jgi:succinyl-diaminopimelate desuccinylase
MSTQDLSSIGTLAAATRSPAHRAIQSYLNQSFPQQVDLLAELVRVPSDNPPGDCAAHAERTAALLQELGWTVERHPVPQAAVEAVGMRSAVNLVVRRTFGTGPVIALNAHGDVVPPGEGWTQDPYGAAIVGGAMFGRGVAVSKSDIATYAFALKALEAAAEQGSRLGGTIELHITYDEESGGEIGPRRLLEQGTSRPDLALGAGFAYAVVVAHNGVLHLEVKVHGKQAHAAMPYTGVDALVAANAVLTALYQHRQGYSRLVSKVEGIGSPQLTVGLIHGGVNTNVVPDLITFRLDRRMIPEESPADVERDLTALIQRTAAAFPGVRCEIKRILLAQPLRPLPGHERLAEAIVRNAEDVLGERIPANGVPLYTDARHYAERDIPIVLYGAGPRSILEANAHRADENLRLSDLRKATEVVARALSDLLSQ